MGLSMDTNKSRLLTSLKPPPKGEPHKPCDVCRCAIPVSKPHLTKDQCIKTLQNFLVNANERVKHFQIESKGRMSMAWFLIKDRGGKVFVDEKEFSAVPDDAVVQIAERTDGWDFHANRESQIKKEGS